MKGGSMDAEKVDLTDVPLDTMRWAPLTSLHLRARESRFTESILADHAAVEALNRINYDFDTMDRSAKAGISPFMAAVRAKQLDRWAADFLSRHPEAIVLHLGCGLDSRAFRIDLPVGVRWYDIDFPEMIELRRKIYPTDRRHHTIGASVTEPGWLECVPDGQPVLIVAEGLLMLLPEEDVRVLLNRLTDRFLFGELIFDALAPWVTRFSDSIYWGVATGRDVERMNQRLRLVDEVFLTAHHRQVPIWRYRAVLHFMNTLPGVRSMARQLRYEF
jgi:O-methyltransferase involved in polyketide biosynthesis